MLVHLMRSLSQLPASVFVSVVDADPCRRWLAGVPPAVVRVRREAIDHFTSCMEKLGETEAPLPLIARYCSSTSNTVRRVLKLVSEVQC